VILEALKEVTEFALIVGLLYLALGAFARRRGGELSSAIERHPLFILFLLALAVTAIKVGRNVMAGESGSVDEAILRYVHEHVPRYLEGCFRAITFTGSSRFLFPLVIVADAALLATRKRFEALLLGVSAAASTLVIYSIKAAVGRARPSLWQTDGYWGWSFPSGHTLQTATAASVLVICFARIRPKTVRLIAPLAVVWVLLVALSRLVLGAHWPSDVLAATCLGVIIPFIVLLILQRWRSR
jgi:undecaprenyl-diphosphatase